jgi:hypothetical protein
MNVRDQHREPKTPTVVPRAYLVLVTGGVLDGAIFEVHSDCETNALICMRWALLQKRGQRVLPFAEVIGRVLRPRVIRVGEPTVYLEEF